MPMAVGRGFDSGFGPAEHVTEERERSDDAHELPRAGRARVGCREVAVIRHEVVDVCVCRCQHDGNIALIAADVQITGDPLAIWIGDLLVVQSLQNALEQRKLLGLQPADVDPG